MYMDQQHKTRLNLDVAQASARQGYYVAPGACDGSATLAGPATRFAARIAKWWQRWPDACIGIDLGRSGLVVVEVRADEAQQIEIERVLPRTPVIAQWGDIRRYFYRRGAEQTFSGLISHSGSIKVLTAGVMMVPSC